MPGEAADPANIPIHRAAFHSSFNLLNNLLVIGFVPQLARLVVRILPDRATPKLEHLRFHSLNILQALRHRE